MANKHFRLVAYIKKYFFIKKNSTAVPYQSKQELDDRDIEKVKKMMEV